MKYRGKAFSKMEDAIIINDRKKGLTRQQIAEHLVKVGYNRTLNSVQTRLRHLFKKEEVERMPNGARRIFTEEQDTKIIDYVKEGRTYVEIAKLLSTDDVTYMFKQVSRRCETLRKHGLMETCDYTRIGQKYKEHILEAFLKYGNIENVELFKKAIGY